MTQGFGENWKLAVLADEKYDSVKDKLLALKNAEKMI